MEESSPPCLGVSLETPRAVIRTGERLGLESLTPCAKLSRRGWAVPVLQPVMQSVRPLRSRLTVWRGAFLALFSAVETLVTVPPRVQFSQTEN